MHPPPPPPRPLHYGEICLATLKLVGALPTERGLWQPTSQSTFLANMAAGVVQQFHLSTTITGPPAGICLYFAPARSEVGLFLFSQIPRVNFLTMTVLSFRWRPALSKVFKNECFVIQKVETVVIHRRKRTNARHLSALALCCNPKTGFRSHDYLIHFSLELPAASNRCMNRPADVSSK